MKEKIPKLMTMASSKKELFHAGRENFFAYLHLEEQNEKLKIINASMLNTLKFILENVPTLTFIFEDDGLEDDVVEKPKDTDTGMEVA